MSLLRLARKVSYLASTSPLNISSAQCILSEPNNGLRRVIHSRACLHALDVVIPQLGESITEGSIANLLKAANDNVEEDEPIMQVETDKVTIDIRAPTRGTLRAVLVKEEDVVTVGKVVALMDETSDAVSGTNKLNANHVDLVELTAAANDVSDSTMRGNKARIKFPPRRTPEGLVISAMPVIDQKKYITRSTIAATAAKTSEAAIASSGLTGTKSGVRSTVIEPLARRELSEEEMEAIMLGGAM